ncbi:hypothetical protein KXW47_007558, partial [Aspergillus fumigatus]
MEPLSILTLVGTLASLLSTVNDALTEYQQSVDKRRKAFSTLKDIESECIATSAVAESTKKIVEHDFSQETGEQNRLIDVLGSNVKELERLVTSLDESIKLILRHKSSSKIRNAIATKEVFLKNKLQKIRQKRGLIGLVTQALMSGDILEMKRLVKSSLGNTREKMIDEKGRELMEEVAGEKRTDIIQRLLKEGADPNFLTIDFRPPGHPKAVTPLLYAIQGPPERCYEAVDVLLSYGAIPNLVVGDEPLLWQAFASGNIEIATMLLDAGADVQYPCVKGGGRSLLGTAVFSESFADRKLELVELALMYGANTDTKAPNGNTPLHDAVEMRKGIEIVDVLLRAYANVDSCARDDLTPLMMAAQIGDQAVTNLLVEN